MDNSCELQAQTQKSINQIKRNGDSLYKSAVEPTRTFDSISKGIIGMLKVGEKHQEQSSKKAKGKYDQDGKRKTGYQINPTCKHIDLKEVAEAENTNIKERMLNLEKQFNKIPLRAIANKSDDLDESVELTNRYANQKLYSPSLKKLS